MDRGRGCFWCCDGDSNGDGVTSTHGVAEETLFTAELMGSSTVHVIPPPWSVLLAE